MSSRPIALPASAVLFAAISSAVSAQTITLATTTTVTASATSAGLSQNVSLPVGPLNQPSVVSLLAFAPGSLPPPAMSILSVTRSPTPHRMLVTLRFNGSITGPAAGAVAAQATDVIASFSLPQPTMVRFELTRALTATIGVPMPRMRVDVNNDGSFEMSELSPVAFVTMPLMVGPTPTPVRLQFDGAFTGAGNLAAELQVEALPGPLTVATNLVAGCGAMYDVRTRFDGGLDLFFDYESSPEIGVIGFGVQPLVLNMLGATPCLLLPSPDVLVTSQMLTLPLPASIRPVTFWTQNVALTPSTFVFRTSDAFQIDAP